MDLYVSSLGDWKNELKDKFLVRANGTPTCRIEGGEVVDVAKLICHDGRWIEALKMFDAAT